MVVKSSRFSDKPELVFQLCHMGNGVLQTSQRLSFLIHPMAGKSTPTSESCYDNYGNQGR